MASKLYSVRFSRPRIPCNLSDLFEPSPEFGTRLSHDGCWWTVLWRCRRSSISCRIESANLLKDWWGNSREHLALVFLFSEHDRPGHSIWRFPIFVVRHWRAFPRFSIKLKTIYATRLMRSQLRKTCGAKAVFDHENFQCTGWINKRFIVGKTSLKESSARFGKLSMVFEYSMVHLTIKLRNVWPCLKRGVS